jgi:hypothetical protein
VNILKDKFTLLAMSLQSNKAVILLGAENARSLAVAKALSDRNITLLRLEPSKVNYTVTPLLQQPNYYSYIHLLPAFMASTQSTVSTARVGHIIQWEVDHILPLGLPNVAVNWTVPIADEIKEDMKAKCGGTMKEVSNGNRIISILQPKNFVQLRAILGYNANPTAPAVENTVNIACISSYVAIMKIFSKFLVMHNYAAFKDKTHFEECKAIWSEKTDEMDTEAIVEGAVSYTDS